MLKEEQKEIKSIKNNKQKEKYYRHLISERKTDFFLLYSFAEFLYSINHKKDNPEVCYLLDQVIDNSNNIQLINKAKMKKAQFLQSIAKYQSAEILYMEVLKSNPNSYKCSILLAQLKYKTYEVEKAKKWLRYTLNSTQRKYRTAAYRNLIELYINEEDYDHALQIVQNFLSDDYTKKYENFISFSLARIYRGKKDYDQACYYMDQVTGLHHKLGNLALEKVRLYTETNNIEKLEKAYNDLSFYQSIEDKIDIEYNLMLIDEQQQNLPNREKHKNKMLSLKNTYRQQFNDHLKW